jgi:pimeloyl-ACP methyl ester carboxylesterase
LSEAVGTVHVVGTRALVTAVTVAAAVLTGCSVAVRGHGSAVLSDAVTPGPAAAGTAHFGSCSDVLDTSAIPVPSGLRDKISFSCATINVPLDYANPARAKILLQLLKVHDSDNDRGIGALLVNPGGPGGSGIELAAGLTAQVADTLLQHFDMIGFDPRGVGLSAPIRCVSDTEKDTLAAATFDIRTAAGFAAAKRLAVTVSAACEARYGAALAQYNTVNTARDMDVIRQAAGDDVMNYLGFSYGTELGAQYAHLFPGRIRVAVLDGAVDPLLDPISSFAAQLKGFEGAFDQFASWCATQSTCRPIGDPRRVVYALVRQAATSPLTTTESGRQRTATGAIVLTGVLSALYTQSHWPTLSEALHDAKGGDPGGLFHLADQYNQRSSDGSYSNIYDANTTIACNDSPVGPSDTVIRGTAATWAPKYPMFGLWAAQSLFACQPWQPTRAVPPKPTATTSAGRILVIGNLHDPATPYQGAIDLAKTLGNAEVLTWDGEGHTSYLEGSSCVDDKVDAYLVDGTLPVAGTTCPR